MPRMKVAEGSSKGCGLAREISDGALFSELHSAATSTHRILLLAGDGSWGGEHEPEHGVLALLLLDGALEGVDVEGDGEPVDGEDESRTTNVDHDLQGETKRRDQHQRDWDRAPTPSTHLLVGHAVRQLVLPGVTLEPPPLLLAPTLSSTPLLAVLLQSVLLPSLRQLPLVLLAAVEGIGVDLAVLVTELGLDDGGGRGFAGGLGIVPARRLGRLLDLLLQARED